MLPSLLSSLSAWGLLPSKDFRNARYNLDNPFKCLNFNWSPERSLTYERVQCKLVQEACRKSRVQEGLDAWPDTNSHLPCVITQLMQAFSQLNSSFSPDMHLSLVSERRILSLAQQIIRWITFPRALSISLTMQKTLSKNQKASLVQTYYGSIYSSLHFVVRRKTDDD